ncbi:unnamed protein product [Umbelopsis vinacea]
MHLFTITAGFLLLMLLQAEAATRNATIPAQTISSMPATPTTELGQKIEVALSIVFLIMGLTFSFAKGIGSLIRWILWPFTVIWRALFSAFIYGPYKAVSHIMHVLYPVATFCFAAACFGILIGGFAGIASEAIASFFIAITWGSASNKATSATPTTATESTIHFSETPTSPPSARQPVTERLMEFGRRKSREFLPSGISSSASSIVDQGYFGEWANRRPSFRTRQLSFHENSDQEEEDGRSETSWDNDDDDTFTLSPAHPTARLR